MWFVLHLYIPVKDHELINNANCLVVPYQQGTRPYGQKA